MEVPVGKGEDAEGVDLTLALNIEDLVSSMEVTPGTRATDDHYSPQDNVDFKQISSIAVFVINADSEAAGQMVAYRIIAPPDKIKPDIWYLGKDPENSEKTRTWANEGIVNGVRTSYSRFNNYYAFDTNDDDYNGCDILDGKGFCDDQHYGCWKTDADGKLTMELEDDCVGYNGFARVSNNELVTNLYGGVNYPAFDTDGHYDENYNSNPNEDSDYDDFRDYKIGKRYHKSPAVILSFKYDNPMHGPVEQLKRGNYYILALANFRESVSDISLYNPTANQFSQGGENKFDGDVTYNGDGTATATSPTYKNQYVEDFIYTFLRTWDPEEGIHGSQFASFIDSAVSLQEITIGSNGELSPASQGTGNWKDATPLLRSNRARFISTGYQQITLTPGNTNIYQMELNRTVARSTFKVSNYSEHELTVTDFRLSDNFAQGATFLFRPNDSDRFQTRWQGSPKVADNTKPLTNFPAEGYTIAPQTNNTTIFDGITYESGGTGSALSYDITVAYKGVEGDNPTIVGVESVGNPINTLLTDLGSNSWTTGTTRYYLLYNSGTESFVYKNGASIPMDNASATDIQAKVMGGDNSYVWILEKRSGTTVRIKNMDGQYLVRPSSNNSPFSWTRDASQSTTFTVGTNNSYTYFREGVTSGNWWNQTTTYYYIRVNNGNVISSSTNTNTTYSLYPLTMETVNYLTKTLNVPIESFNMTTGIAEPLYYLRRNQHLNVHIGVTYNEEHQTINFNVQDWTDIKNEVTFE